jgi:glycosyltransferase involved in cell wall biosynthesis
VKKLASVLENTHPSIVVVQFLTEAVRFSHVLAHTGLPVLVHCHGWDVTWDMHDHLTGCRRMHPSDYKQQVRALPEQFQFLANSEDTKCRLMSIGIPAARIDVLYFGVTLPSDCPPPPETGNILFLGRLVDFKAPDLVIRAFEIAAARGLAANLVIAGDGPLRTTCELLRARSPFAARIELTGAVDERKGEELRRRACIFTAHNCQGALTRQTEAFGVAFIEAMAAGLPIVTGRSGGITETVRDGTACERVDATS